MRRGMRAVAAVALALGVLQGCTVEDRDVLYAEPDEPTTASECAGGVPGRSLEQTLRSVGGLARRHPDVYTGLSVDADDGAADVYRVPSADFDDDACGAAGKGVTLRLHDTEVSRRELDSLAVRISADMHRWEGAFDLREVGVDERGWVHVGVDDPAAAKGVIAEEFGPEHIRVVKVGKASAD
ncbi:hypothetical protein ACWCPM_19800 [Streptomyces sp. NPDC002309]